MTKEATLKVGNSSLENLGTAIEQFSKAIQEIFDSGMKNHMEQETIRTAIVAFSEIAKIENVNISGSIFKDKTINIDTDKEDADKEAE